MGNAPANLKNTMEVSQKVVQTAVTSSNTSVDATARASTKQHIKHIKIGKNAKLDLKAKAQVDQVAQIQKSTTNTTEMENEMMSELEQKPAADLTGGMFAPDLNSDNSINMMSSAASSTAAYSNMSLSALAEADTEQIVDDLDMGEGSSAKITAEAVVKQKLMLSQADVTDVANLNVMKNTTEQAPKVVSQDAFGKVMSDGFKAAASIADSFANMLSGPLMVLAVVAAAGLFLLKGGSSIFGGGGGSSGSEGTGAPPGERAADRRKRLNTPIFRWFALLPFFAATVVLAVLIFVVGDSTSYNADWSNSTVQLTTLGLWGLGTLHVHYWYIKAS